MFIDPQLGRVGMTEREATAQGHSIRVAKLPMSAVIRALETGETRGFMADAIFTHPLLAEGLNSLFALFGAAPRTRTPG
jgi:hypothetical protein